MKNFIMASVDKNIVKTLEMFIENSQILDTKLNRAPIKLKDVYFES